MEFSIHLKMKIAVPTEREIFLECLWFGKREKELLITVTSTEIINFFSNFQQREAD